jgi:predicted nucleotidyltransferase
MAKSINYHFKNIASKYYLKNDSVELLRIESSINNLFKNLDEDLKYLMNRKFIFGSYDRDTILPRKYDSNSDIDIMVVFNHTKYERTTETYRSWLKLFAEKYYKNRYGSEVVKSFPTITIKLNNINYDLVPAKEEDLTFLKRLYIPGEYGWISTNPNDVKNNLLEVNKNYNFIVKPIIRLLKGWNSNANYPLNSYDLELQVSKMNFFNDTIETGFFWAAKRLSLSSNAAQWKKDKLTSLRSSVYKIEDALTKDDEIKALIETNRILPNE